MVAVQRQSAAGETGSDTDPYGGRFYRIYQQILQGPTDAQTVTLTVMAALLGRRYLGIWFGGRTFPFIEHAYFLCRSLASYGTDIATTEKMASDIRNSINGQPELSPPSPPLVRAVCGFILT